MNTACWPKALIIEDPAKDSENHAKIGDRETASRRLSSLDVARQYLHKVRTELAKQRGTKIPHHAQIKPTEGENKQDEQRKTVAYDYDDRHANSQSAA